MNGYSYIRVLIRVISHKSEDKIVGCRGCKYSGSRSIEEVGIVLNGMGETSSMEWNDDAHIVVRRGRIWLHVE